MTPEQEEQVRRALAAVRDAEPGTQEQTPPGRAEPMPPKVAARLDGVLADLSRQRSADAPPVGGTTHPPIGRTAGHDELARRRRRRWQQAGLLAAAASVAAVVATGGSIGGLGQGSSSTTASEDARADAVSGSSAAPERAPAVRATRPSPRPFAWDRATKSLRVSALPRLRSSTLTSDVQRLVDADSLRPVSPRSPGLPCDAPALQQGDRLYVVLLDGRRASLVLGAPDAGSRAARTVACRDTGTTLGTAVVRTR